MSTHSFETVLLSLGSNIEPDRYLPAATRLLAGHVQIVAASQVFETKPAGQSRGPAFLNAALEIRCDFEPGRLKHQILRPLEQELGRERCDDRDAPRTIDVDISLFGQRVIYEIDPQLEIPDPEILVRAHVAIPLADVSPGTLHPVVGLTLGEIAGRFRGRGVSVFEGLALWPPSDRF